jgi:hypothetical protein
MHFLDLGAEDEFNNSDRIFSFRKGGDDMGRLMVLNVLALFLCSVVPLGCSTGSERPISQSDIPDLIGKWEGKAFAVEYTEPVTMQILNDSLEGKISFQPNTFGSPPTIGGTFTGRIENGSLAASWGKDCWINMKLRQNRRKMKLQGTIQTPIRQGTMTLEKVKQ